MRKYIIIVFVTLGIAGGIFLYKGLKKSFKPRTQTPRASAVLAKEQLDLDKLDIENYVFTKLSDTKGILRVYAFNGNKASISSFPVQIDYYSREGHSISSDQCDLLEESNSVLKGFGKFNAEIEVTTPQDTHRLELKIERD